MEGLDKTARRQVILRIDGPARLSYAFAIPGIRDFRFGSLCRALHNDPYADLAIMRRKRADPVLFSHEVGLNSA